MLAVQLPCSTHCCSDAPGLAGRKPLMPAGTQLLIAVVAFAIAGACAKKIDDAELVTNIKSQMFSDPQLKDASLQVTSRQGSITLTGTVPSDAAHYEAYKIATETPGVRKVDDQMTVQVVQAEPSQQAEPAPSPTPAHSHKSPMRKRIS